MVALSTTSSSGDKPLILISDNGTQCSRFYTNTFQRQTPSRDDVCNWLSKNDLCWRHCYHNHEPLIKELTDLNSITTTLVQQLCMIHRSKQVKAWHLTDWPSNYAWWPIEVTQQEDHLGNWKQMKRSVAGSVSQPAWGGQKSRLLHFYLSFWLAGQAVSYLWPWQPNITHVTFWSW